MTSAEQQTERFNETTGFLASFQERLYQRGEGGMVSLYVGGTALALTTSLAVGVGLYARAQPHSEFDSDGHLSVETLDIRPINFDCRSMSTFAVEGQVGTHWVIFGKGLPGTGYGSRFAHNEESGDVDPRAKVKMELCGTDPEITTEDEGNVKVVKFNVDSLTADTSFIESDTKVVASPGNKSFTEALNGSALTSDAAAHLGCNILTLGQAQDQCKKIDLASWAHDSQANLDRALRYQTLKVVQEQCGPLEWEANQAAIIQSYQNQAVEQGFEPDNVRVEFVNSNGDTYNGVPSFAKSVLDSLKEDGITLSQPPGMDVETVFSDVTCEQLTPEEAGR